MDPVLALAILSFGTFVGICVTGLFYLGAVRPTLLDEERSESKDTTTIALRNVRDRSQGGGENIDSLRYIRDLNVQ